MVWKVLKTRGDCEPWWFFKGWEENIEEAYHFQNKRSAIEKYRLLAAAFIQHYPEYKVKKAVLIAAWNKDEMEYCEDCGDYIQIFHGLLLMEDDNVYKPSSEEQKTFFVF